MRNRNPSIRPWCYTSPKKGSSKSSKSTKPVKASEATEKQKEVDEIYADLQKKHKGRYSPEQLRAWSYMIQLKTHDSLDDPPNKPFFRGNKRRNADSPSRRPLESKRQPPSVVSPGKKFNMRSELMNQLEKWHKL